MASWRHVQSHHAIEVSKKNQIHKNSDDRDGRDVTVLAVNHYLKFGFI